MTAPDWADADPTMDEVEYRLLCEEVRISCTYGMLLCIPRPQRAAYLLADVIGLTDVESAEILDYSREAFRQRVSRARRTLRYVIDNRYGLVDPANPCRCGRQIAAGEQAGILRRRASGSSRRPSSSTGSPPSASCTGSTASRRRRTPATKEAGSRTLDRPPASHRRPRGPSPRSGAAVPAPLKVDNFLVRHAYREMRVHELPPPVL